MGRKSTVARMTDQLLYKVIYFFQELFAKIKYLFKFKEYRDENEIRVILWCRTVDSFQDIEEAGDEDPLRKKLFIHLDKNKIKS